MIVRTDPVMVVRDGRADQVGDGEERPVLHSVRSPAGGRDGAEGAGVDGDGVAAAEAGPAVQGDPPGGLQVVQEAAAGLLAQRLTGALAGVVEQLSGQLGGGDRQALRGGTGQVEPGAQAARGQGLGHPYGDLQGRLVAGTRRA